MGVVCVGALTLWVRSWDVILGMGFCDTSRMKTPHYSPEDESAQLGLFAYEIDEAPLEVPVTSYAGIPAIVETLRVLGGSVAVARHVRVKERQRGFTEPQLVEAFVALLAAGGDCPEDFEAMRGDPGLPELLGRRLPSRTPARQFLYGFHDEELMKGRPERDEQASWVPPESEALSGLGTVNETVVRAAAEHGAEACTRATLDMDASIIESHKREAYWHYEGGRGYQPEVVVWAEHDLIVADEFRDGNVPAGKDPLTVVRRGFAALPETVEEYAFRGDSACYEHDLLNWLRNPEREGGPRGTITFAISADMTRELRQAVEELDEGAWSALEARDEKKARGYLDEQRHVADVAFVPDGRGITKHTQPDRYVAIRILARQGELFADGAQEKYFAIVTNDFERSCSQLVHWQRAKAGTVEHVHDVLKNDLGAGTLPCGRFGANAAWFRLNVLTYNVLSAFKRLTLPEKLHTARPKKLRFRLLGRAGKVVRHAGRELLRIAGNAEIVRELHAARAVLKQIWRKVRQRRRELLRQWRRSRGRCPAAVAATG